MNIHAHHHHLPHTHNRAFSVGIGLNVAFILTEIAYGLKSDSLALLADAGHNISDVLGLCMAWGAALLARRAASARFTYGLQSASILATLANALLLLVAVGGITWEAVQRFTHPEPPQTTIIIVVALIGTAINGLTAFFFRDHHHDLNIRGAFLHMAADAAISLGVALSGGVILATGWLWLDPLVSLLIATFIVVSTWQLLKESTTLALHAVPESINIEKVRHFLMQLQGVAEVHDLHIWAMSTTGVALSAHLLMPNGHPGDTFLRQTSEALHEQFHITHATFQIELGDSTSCQPECGQYC